MNFDCLRKERLEKAKAVLNSSDLGSLICYDFDNIRYITGTHVGEWCRNKMNRYCILPKGAEPLLFDPASPAKKISCPWLANRIFPAVGSMRGAIPPEVQSVEKVAQEIYHWLQKHGVEKMPVGMDNADIPLVRALERLNLKVVDGQETMLEARMIKTKDEIELLKISIVSVSWNGYAHPERMIALGNYAVALHFHHRRDVNHLFFGKSIWKDRLT